MVAKIPIYTCYYLRDGGPEIRSGDAHTSYESAEDELRETIGSSIYERHYFGESNDDDEVEAWEYGVIIGNLTISSILRQVALSEMTMEYFTSLSESLYDGVDNEEADKIDQLISFLVKMKLWHQLERFANAAYGETALRLEWDWFSHPEDDGNWCADPNSMIAYGIDEGAEKEYEIAPKLTGSAFEREFYKVNWAIIGTGSNTKWERYSITKMA